MKANTQFTEFNERRLKNCHVDIALDQSTEFSKTDHQTLFGDII